MLSKHQIVNWLLDCEHIFTEQRDYLTALDTDIGDGDHGLNMQRGFAKVTEKLPPVADKDIGQVLKTTGMTLLSSVGGASGPLYGTFFIRAAASTDACQSLSLSQLCKMLSDGVEGIVSRGRYRGDHPDAGPQGARQLSWRAQHRPSGCRGHLDPAAADRSA